MAGKPTKLPKALQGLAADGKDLAKITVADLALLSEKQRADVHNAMSYALKKADNAEKLQQYKSLKTDEERRKAQVFPRVPMALRDP